MKITDLNEQNKNIYLLCLQDNNTELREVGHHKESWYNKMKPWQI